MRGVAVSWLLDSLVSLARRIQAARAAEKAAWLKQFNERLRGVSK
jgi:hypothetical protein